jgi:hypothetical protein
MRSTAATSSKAVAPFDPVRSKERFSSAGVAAREPSATSSMPAERDRSTSSRAMSARQARSFASSSSGARSSRADDHHGSRSSSSLHSSPAARANQARASTAGGRPCSASKHCTTRSSLSAPRVVRDQTSFESATAKASDAAGSRDTAGASSLHRSTRRAGSSARKAHQPSV